MKTLFEKLSAWWRGVDRQPAPARYVRKPKIHRESTYASRALIPASQLVARLRAEREALAAVSVTRHVGAHQYRGSRRAPGGVAVMLRRVHRRAIAAARESAPARSKRLGDVTGQIPRRIAYHGARVKLSLRRAVRDGAWVLA